MEAAVEAAIEDEKLLSDLAVDAAAAAAKDGMPAWP
jgi:hypothetical protein